MLTSIKEFFELSYWKLIKTFSKNFNNSHYKYFYTTFFSLPEDFYNNKSILDIGCGPLGSLEWADMTAERIGLDPLANKYRKLGTAEHKMEYVKAYVENIPFAEDHFDVVTSFNSLDHVGNLEQACTEIQRVLKPGGIFLLIVDVHNYPTPTEPQRMRWDFLTTHFPQMEILEEKHLEKVIWNRIYTSARLHKELEADDQKTGILAAKLIKTPL